MVFILVIGLASVGTLLWSMNSRASTVEVPHVELSMDELYPSRDHIAIDIDTTD